jgi:prepilin-type N-terminal cleavage/methylation domain-containing protein
MWGRAVRGAALRRGGFTIVELLIALILVALTATASISAFFSRSEVTLDNAARLLAEDLRSAQSRATLLRCEVVFHFAPDGTGYESYDKDRRPRPQAKGPPGTRRNFERDAVFEGVRISDVQVGGADHVLFQPDGSVAEGGQVTIAYRGATRTVVIEPGKSWIRVADSSDD